MHSSRIACAAFALLSGITFADVARAEFPQVKINHIDASQAPKIRIWASVVTKGWKPPGDKDLTGITLYTHFDLLIAAGFEVRTGLWLSRPERPFGMAILFLGGGGWFGVDVRYKPPLEFETRVSVGLAAGAFVALNFGVARGSAGILFTVGLEFYRDWLQSGSQDLAITIGILVWGEFSILGIVSAYLRVILRVEYRNGEMTGYGSVSVCIKICWCFTLRVNAPARLPFSSGSRKAASAPAPHILVAPAPARPTTAQIFHAHFANLDV